MGGAGLSQEQPRATPLREVALAAAIGQRRLFWRATPELPDRGSSPRGRGHPKTPPERHASWLELFGVECAVHRPIRLTLCYYQLVCIGSGPAGVRKEAFSNELP
jgi:hypothetical protein